MIKMPTKAFVLAAGKGERMRPLTNTCPKPMLKVAGKTMLDRALDALVVAGVEDVVVNTFYLPDVIENYLSARKNPRITVSRETELLDTGGGVLNKIDFFGDDPFFVLNADIIWEEGKTPALERLATAWKPDEMDILLLLHPTAGLSVHAGAGDYILSEERGRPRFFKGGDHIFTGLRIVHPRIFNGITEKNFSFLDLFHRAEKAGRLFGLRHDGAWHHVGTPDALAETEKILAAC